MKKGKIVSSILIFIGVILFVASFIFLGLFQEDDVLFRVMGITLFICFLSAGLGFASIGAWIFSMLGRLFPTHK